MHDEKDVQVGDMPNPVGALAPDDEAASRQLRDQSRASLWQYQAALRSDPVIAARHKIQGETRRDLASLIPDFDARSNSFHETSDQIIITRIGQLPSWWPPELAPQPPPPPPPPPVAGVGEFWWAGTSWSHNVPGVTIDFPASDLRIFGHGVYKRDALLAAHAGLIAVFGLSPNRFPPTAATMFRSAPQVLLTGMVSGWTGFYHPIWGADDKWCKCWLVRRQTIFQPGGALLANAIAVDEQFNLDNEYVIGQANRLMPGSLAMPSATFTVPDRAKSVIVHLEVRFDVQMEGDADIRFAQRAGFVASPDNAVLVRHPQWKIEPL